MPKKLAVQKFETQRNILGAGHLNTLVSLAHLAATYFEMNRLSEAKDFHKQLLEKRKKLL